MPQRKGTYKHCETCGKDFYCPPSKFSQRWCSIPCVPVERRSLGPQHQQKPAVTITCAHCAVEFTARPWALAYGRKFCSRECLYASGASQTDDAKKKRRQSTGDRTGKKNPNYKTGRRVGGHIRGFTLKAKGEDRCRNCGGVGTGETHRLHLHHAIPRSLSREARDKILNGIPLCPKCHHGWHRRRLTIYRDVFTPDEWAYISSVQLTGQNIEAWLDDRYPKREYGLQGCLPRYLAEEEAA
jgi:hypothetical protein